MPVTRMDNWISVQELLTGLHRTIDASLDFLESTFCSEILLHALEILGLQFP